MHSPAVIFYGSCLRKRTDEGVLDFYALVDDYRAAYRSRYLRTVNAALPPNVFFLEFESPIGTLRSKSAVEVGIPLLPGEGDGVEFGIEARLGGGQVAHHVVGDRRHMADVPADRARLGVRPPPDLLLGEVGPQVVGVGQRSPVLDEQVGDRGGHGWCPPSGSRRSTSFGR